MFWPGTTSPEILAQSKRLNVSILDAEIQHFQRIWFSTWQEKWARHVALPAMFSLVENDPFFQTTKEELDTCISAFKHSVRVDGNLVHGAPHWMELSYWSQGWYGRCFGFAIECSVNMLIENCE